MVFTSSIPSGLVRTVPHLLVSQRSLARTETFSLYNLTRNFLSVCGFVIAVAPGGTPLAKPTGLGPHMGKHLFDRIDCELHLHSGDPTPISIWKSNLAGITGLWFGVSSGREGLFFHSNRTHCYVQRRKDDDLSRPVIFTIEIQWELSNLPLGE